ncbi:hypothetical protein D7322_24685 [Sphingobacterium puteale]|uniref:Uncharacterized protein n=1 Tax=Sphingobacterium puteale TaxID=2420510 RepID=A0A420VRX6_9SPHI|nr:hypothetical protein [Sphingobacterium puteale]RKO68989.1 hypothetical protein D7322_24685 [Sphingobacterium puteale]
MKVTHVLGHNSNWNVESYLQHDIGDFFLITAFTHGARFDTKKGLLPILPFSMIDLQFYGKKTSGDITKGSLSEFPFHPANCSDEEVTSIYFDNCLKQAIKYQEDKGFKNIIIPHFYENEEVSDIVSTIKNINHHVAKNKLDGRKYFMTLAFANHIIIDKAKVEEILFCCTDMDICFDGYFVTCENKPETRKKLTTDIKILRNLSNVFKTLKIQQFETIYAYANWDAIVILAQTDIDYVTIGTYENLRKFDIVRFTEDQSGGGSKGYYFSEKLLNMVKANDLTSLRDLGQLDRIKNERNIFSDIILRRGYDWNIHKPDVNKNYLLSINRLLHAISAKADLSERKKYVQTLVQSAIDTYNELENNYVYLDNESGNYHLNIWKSYLASS